MVHRLLLTLGLLFPALAVGEWRVIPGEYLVSYATEARRTLAQEATSEARVVDVRPLGSNIRLVRDGLPVAALGGTQVQATQPYDPNDDFCRQLAAQRAVTFCSPNFEIRSQRTANDPSLPTLWGLNAASGIDAPSAWDVSTGSAAVVVAVLDSGIDYTHEDLTGALWTNTGEIPGNGIDDDHNGYVDDVHGVNLVSRSAEVMDDFMHGTHVSGTIAARGDNSVGVAGVAWNVQILPVKILDAYGAGSLAQAIEGLQYIVALKQRGVPIYVSNNSWGGAPFVQPVLDAIAKARDAGIIFVAAAGNFSQDMEISPSYPASYDLDNVVSVAAVDSQRALASFSNYGATKVDIAAPGVDILSTVPGGGYSALQGTSMAAPHVAGALALLFSAEPSLSYTEAITRLYQTSVHEAGLDGVVAGGRFLNVGRLLHNEVTPQVEDVAHCKYSVEQIQYRDLPELQNSTLIQQADEYQFVNVALPFKMPFFTNWVRSLKVSPNGLVYTAEHAHELDFENAAAAPLSSIAALQTDLAADGAPFGVRMYSDDSRLSLYWRAQPYSRQGSVDVYLTVYRSGMIETFARASDEHVAKELGRAATAGIHGAGKSEALTAFHNEWRSLVQGFGVRYAAQCSSSASVSTGEATVRSMQVVDSKGKKTDRTVRAGERVRISLRGVGSGVSSMAVSLNQRECLDKIPVNLISGRARVVLRMPQLPQWTSSVTLRSGARRLQLKLANARHEKVNRSLSAGISSACTSLLKRISLPQ